MHPSHASVTLRELDRQELLAFAEQQRLAELALTGTPRSRPYEARAVAVLAFVHRLTAFMPLALRERSSTGPASTATDSPSPLTTPGS